MSRRGDKKISVKSAAAFLISFSFCAVLNIFTALSVQNAYTSESDLAKLAAKIIERDGFGYFFSSLILSLAASFAVAFIVQKVQNLSALRSQFEDMANSDPLIGIYNRRYFMEAAKTQIARSMRLNARSYIVIYDLDHFKFINDEFTHLAGDKVLKEVSLMVKSMLRTYDLFARYGGEEFIILLTDMDSESVVSCIERIRKEINDQIVTYDGHPISVTASFGIAPVNKSIDLETALKLADEALYKAKQDGRNKVHMYKP